MDFIRDGVFSVLSGQPEHIEAQDFCTGAPLGLPLPFTNLNKSAPRPEIKRRSVKLCTEHPEEFHRSSAFFRCRKRSIRDRKAALLLCLYISASGQKFIAPGLDVMFQDFDISTLKFFVHF